MQRFTVSQLESDLFAAAFPLVRMAVPGIEPSAWAAFVEGIGERDGAMLGVFAGDSTLHGVAIYRVEDSLRGRRLAADAIVTFELNRAAPARAALIAGLEREAAQLGCAVLALSLPARGYVDAGSAKAEAWLREGFGFDSVMLSRPVEAEAEALTAP
jgi:hypothetical protein